MPEDKNPAETKPNEIKLKVGELTERSDYGRGIVRISAKDMKKIGVGEGDIIEIEGKRKTVAIVLRAYPADVGLDIVRMDGLVRKNCGAGISDEVKVRKSDVKEARIVTIAPARKGIVIHISGELLKRNILMRPVTTGDIIVPNPILRSRRDNTFESMFEEFFGIDFVLTPFGEEKFVVTSTDPKGSVRITKSTEVEVLPQAKDIIEEKIPEVTYEDLGGLHNEIQLVREMIELPLKHPELFERLGIEPPKGILLHGHPGTGKTLLAKAVANESGAKFYVINGPEIMCVDGETKIFTNPKGFVKAKEIFNNAPDKKTQGKLVTSKLKEPVSTYSIGKDGKIEKAKITHVAKLKAPAYKLRLSDGNEITGSHNQPMLVYENGRLIWKRILDLKKGQFIARLNNLQLPENSHIIPVEKIENVIKKGLKYALNSKNSSRSNFIELPDKTSPELLEFLGLVVSDGYIGKEGVEFANNDKELLNRFKLLTKIVFNPDNIKESNNKIIIYSKILVEYLKLLDFENKNKLKTPRYFYALPKKEVQAFIRGYFDGDGCITKLDKSKKSYPSIKLFSVSKEFLQEMQALMQIKLNIPTKLNPHNTPKGLMYEIVVRGYGKKRFLEVGSSTSAKQKRLDIIKDIEERDDFRIPVPESIINEIRSKLPYKDYRNKDTYIYRKEKLTKHALQKLYNILKTNNLVNKQVSEEFNTLMRDDIAWEKIEDIENIGEQELYDFTVDDSENFVGGPYFFMHNSRWYGGSLPYEEKILVLENGMPKQMQIGDVVEKDMKNLKVLAFDEKGKTIWSNILDLIKHPNKAKMYEIKTKSGRTIKVTGDHSLFTFIDGKIKSIKTKYLKEGESYIAIPKNMPDPEKPSKEINLLDHLKENDFGLLIREKILLKTIIKKLGYKKTAKLLEITVDYLYDIVDKNVGIAVSKFLKLVKEADIEIKPNEIKVWSKRKYLPAILELSEDFCQVLGLFVAEGSYNYQNSDKECVRLSLHEKEIEKIKPTIEKLFGKVTIYNKKGTQETDIYINSKVLSLVLREILGFNHGSLEKTIPDIVFALPEKQLAAFMKGYFSGDGALYSNKTGVYTLEGSTRSKELANNLMYLLLRFGIVAKLYKTRQKDGLQYRVCFTGADNLRKFQTIGFLDQQKNLNIENYLSGIKFERNYQTNIIDKLEKQETPTIIEDLVPETDIELQDPYDTDIFWDQIKEIKELDRKDEYVYDIGVKPCQNFVGGIGGIFAHNSEENLRKIFDEAEKNAPSIIFIDEIDSIAPKREEVKGEVEKRVVSQLLTLLDGLKSRGKIIVIGATNIPNSLDPALRRPGRLDREIEISVPTKEGRKEILQIHTRGMPLAKDVDILKIAEITYGYVGADIAALCKEAAMYALRRILPEIGSIKEDKPLPPDILKKLIVTASDFQNAMKMVQPSAMREVLMEIPNVKWTDVGGLEEVKQHLKESVEWPLKHPDSFKRVGIKPPKGILLYGPPGCGKTMLAKAVANESGANFIYIKAGELLSMWVGESERHLRDVFRRAKQVAPAIIFFDEIDSLAPKRGLDAGNQVTERVVSQMLAEMSGLEELNDVVVIAATNRPDIIDPALLRPGRFDRQILVTTPDREARLNIMKIITTKMPLEGVDINDIADITEGYSGADLEALCREAAIHALRKDIDADKVTKSDFKKALEEVKPSVSEEMNKFYENTLIKKKAEKLEVVDYTG